MKVTSYNPDSYRERVTNFYRWVLALFLLPSAICLAQPVASPNVKCVSVAANGNVTLTWVTPAGPGGFLDYKISSSLTLAGPYSVVGSVNTYSLTSFTHVGVGANTKRVYYLVQSEYNPGPVLSAPTDTFSTLFLNVTNPGTGNAQLSWNAIATPAVSTSTGWYKIYMERPIGTWSLHDSTQILSYNDNFHVCNDTLSYRIEIADNTGCSSVSNVTGKKLKDNSPPTIAAIDTLSVNGSGFATISWYQSPSPDASSVIIYRGGGPWFPVDTVPVLPALYTYTASNASTVSEQYSIAFLDSCGNTSSIVINKHQTMYLSASFDACAGTADLAWNPYINMSAPVNQYEILVSVNGGAFNLIATTKNTAYTYTGLVIGTAYCYIVRATNGTKTSSSNQICFTPNVANPPAFTYNRFATVRSNTSILITGYVDPASSVNNYRIERAVSGGVFSVLTTIPTFSVTANTITYTDKNVNTQGYSYSYKWKAIDSCSQVIMTSNLGTTILLSASVAPNLDIALSWSDYGDWPDSVDHYEIFRAVDGVWSSTPTITVGTTYTDDVSPFFSTSRGVFSYYVAAIERNGNIYAFKDSSKSNIAKVYEYPKIYVPNTFTPNEDGLNDIFIPVIGFINPREYALTIYDNTGTPVITSTDPKEGWDGKKKGHNCPEGVYMYVINCTASNGDNSQVSGTVSLIR
ncbi:MAG: gliding motility-associated C-terminal domain-containing protein [Bacteroidetes bacterium]|nr:gliding motility-associated C-terminal domain-containing protein [Bacteroidota bacterium]